MRNPTTPVSPASGPVTNSQLPVTSGATFQPTTGANPSRILSQLSQGLGIYGNQKNRQEALAQQRREQAERIRRQNLKDYQDANKQMIDQRTDKYLFDIQRLEAVAATQTGQQRMDTLRQAAAIAVTGMEDPDLPDANRTRVGARAEELRQANTDFQQSLVKTQDQAKKAKLKKYSTNSVAITEGTILAQDLVDTGQGQNIDLNSIRETIVDNAVDYLLTQADQGLIDEDYINELLRSDQFNDRVNERAIPLLNEVKVKSAKLIADNAQQELERSIESATSDLSRSPAQRVRDLQELGKTQVQAIQQVRRHDKTRLQALPPRVESFDTIRNARNIDIYAYSESDYSNLVGETTDRFVSSKLRNYTPAQRSGGQLQEDLAQLAARYDIVTTVDNDQLKYVSTSGQTFSVQLAKKLTESTSIVSTGTLRGAWASGEEANDRFRDSFLLNTLSTGDAVIHSSNANHRSSDASVANAMQRTAGVAVSNTVLNIREKARQLMLQGDAALGNPKLEYEKKTEAFQMAGVADGMYAGTQQGDPSEAITRISQALQSGSDYELHWAVNYLLNNPRAKTRLMRDSSLAERYVAKRFYQDYRAGQFTGNDPGHLQGVTDRYRAEYEDIINKRRAQDDNDAVALGEIRERVGDSLSTTKWLSLKWDHRFQDSEIDATSLDVITRYAIIATKGTNIKPTSQEGINKGIDAMSADGYSVYRRQGGFGVTRSPFAISAGDNRQFFSSMKGARLSSPQSMIEVTLTGDPVQRNYMTQDPKTGEWVRAVSKPVKTVSVSRSFYADQILQLAVARTLESSPFEQDLLGQTPQERKGILEILAGKGPKGTSVQMFQTEQQLTLGGATLRFQIKQVDGSFREGDISFNKEQWQELNRLPQKMFKTTISDRSQLFINDQDLPALWYTNTGQQDQFGRTMQYNREFDTWLPLGPAPDTEVGNNQ